MKIGFRKVALCTVFAGLAAPVALAQSTDNPFERGRYTAVTERPQPDFDPEPVRAGTFDVWASLGLSAEFNDNVFAQDINEESDTILRVQPAVEARSNWSSHELNAGVAIDHRGYQENDSETVTDYNAFVGGRLDVQRSFHLNGRLSAAHVTEQRYEPSGAAAGEPAQYDAVAAQAVAVFQRDRYQLEGQVGTTTNDFNTPFAFRDATENHVFGRASLAVSPDVALFVQGRNTEIDYDLDATLADPRSRDGTRTNVQAGASFELQAPFRGELAVGSVNDDKDDPTRPDTDGLSVNAQVLWFPTQLSTFTFRAFRSVFDPGLQNSASATSTTFGARVDHELRRNIIWYADINTGKYEFSDIDREDEFTDFGFGVSYKLNKRAHLTGGYRFHTRDSSGGAADRDLDQNVFSIGIRLFP
jgi:hypothetical protein